MRPPGAHHERLFTHQRGPPTGSPHLPLLVLSLSKDEPRRSWFDELTLSGVFTCRCDRRELTMSGVHVSMRPPGAHERLFTHQRGPPTGSPHLPLLVLSLSKDEPPAFRRQRIASGGPRTRYRRRAASVTPATRSAGSAIDGVGGRERVRRGSSGRSPRTRRSMSSRSRASWSSVISPSRRSNSSSASRAR